MSDARQDFYNLVVEGIEFLPKGEEYEEVRLQLRKLQEGVMHSVGALIDYCNGEDFINYLNRFK